MSEPKTSQEHFEQLQAERALFGLSEQEFAELRTLSQDWPDADLEDFDRVAAAVELALHESPAEPMPETLKQTLQAQASQHFLENPPPAVSPPTPARAPAAARVAWAPWLAAAACLAFAVVIWSGNQPKKLSAVQQRDQLLASANDLIQVKWTPGPDHNGRTSGDVVWSPSRQEGYMRFRGLPTNQPSQEQYQLWIFAKNQSKATPIDGGVFDISAKGEAVVPIDAKLRAEEVYLFAITVEQPGGVVVSERKNLPVLAPVEAPKE